VPACDEEDRHVHTLMSLDAEWRRLARASRARRALRQWSIVHPALRGVADLDALLGSSRIRLGHGHEENYRECPIRSDDDLSLPLGQDPPSESSRQNRARTGRSCASITMCGSEAGMLTACHPSRQMGSPCERFQLADPDTLLVCDDA
jgi:hypothetical protein